jgi:hypothetical protein
VRSFLDWCEMAGIASVTSVTTIHVAAYIKQLGQRHPRLHPRDRLKFVLIEKRAMALCAFQSKLTAMIEIPALVIYQQLDDARP